MSTGKLNLPEILSGQINKHTTHNAALRLIDSQLNLIVESVGTNTPPGSPTTGKSYVIGASPTGAWASKQNQIANWDGVSWTFFDPASSFSPGNSWTIVDRATNRIHCLNSSSFFVKTGLGFGPTGGIEVGDNTVDGGYGVLYTDTGRCNTHVIGSIGLADAATKSFFTHAAPSQQFYATSGALNTKVWTTRYSGAVLTHTISDDSGGSENSWLRVERVATAILSVNFPSGNFGIGLLSTPDRKFHVEQDSATTNTITYVARLTSTSTGTPANGIGVGVEFEVHTSPANNEIGATIEVAATDTTALSEDFDLIFKTMAAGSAALERVRINNFGLGVGTAGITQLAKVTINSLDKHLAFRYAGTGAYVMYLETTSDGTLHLKGNTETFTTPQTLITFQQTTNTPELVLSIPGPGSSITLNGGVGSGVARFDSKTALSNTVVEVLSIGATRNSGTPAAGVGTGMEFLCETATGNIERLAAIRAVTTDVTAASEDAKIVFQTMVAGATAADRVFIGQGLVVGALTDQGSGSVNASSYFISGSAFGSVGVNQTITDETGNFVSGTIYQNTGAYPIQIGVVVRGQTSLVGSAVLEVGSSSPPTITVDKTGIQSSANGLDEYSGLGYIIPANYYFRITTSNMSIVSWARTA